MLYQNISCTNTTHNIDNIHKTQGEILFPSISKLLALLSLTKQDVFVDLGSGLGKVVAQVFLQTPVKQAIGIEITPESHHVATSIAKKIQQDLPDFYFGNRELKFVQENFFEFSLETATIIFINSICFSPVMLLALGKIIDNMPNIHTVITLRPIGNLRKLSFKRALRVECSWDSALCYIYSTIDGEFKPI